jgi:hypothetical protein
MNLSKVSARSPNSNIIELINIHTYIHTDRQTYIHTYIHTYPPAYVMG